MKYGVVEKILILQKAAVLAGRRMLPVLIVKIQRDIFLLGFLFGVGGKGHVQSTEHTNVCTHKPFSLCTCIHQGFKLNSKSCNRDLYRLEVGLDCN